MGQVTEFFEIGVEKVFFGALPVQIDTLPAKARP